MEPTVSPTTISGRRHHLRAFTLIEILIVVLIIGLLAAIVLAQVGNLIGTGRAEALAGTVTHVRGLISYRAGAGEPPIAASGFPATIEGTWFIRDQLPEHTWTQRPMVIEEVTSPATQIYPAVKTFDPGDPAAENAWYNVTNGAFAVRVGDFGDVAENIEAFNQANVARITTLGQLAFEQPRAVLARGRAGGVRTNGAITGGVHAALVSFLLFSNEPLCRPARSGP